MKILWFSSISFQQNKKGKFFYPGGNWITSLLDLFRNDKNFELGIAFFGDSYEISEDDRGIKYYQLGRDNGNIINNYLINWSHTIDNKKDINIFLEVIEGFKPDVIHIFGTETNLASIVSYTNIPTVIHLQGIIGACLNAWSFPGLSVFKMVKNCNLVFFLKGVGFFHDFFRFKNMARRELKYFEECENFIGRTHWDKALTNLYAPNANYFHCDEVIRDGFYNVEWHFKNEGIIRISSTINANIYKGLDLILKTAILLKQYCNIPFEWNVYGIKEGNEYVKIVQDIVKFKFKDNNVFLKGVVLENELLKGLLNSSLFVHSSYIDNSPNSVCEAQLIGLPVISTNVGGISTLIKDGYDGFLIPSNEPHILVYKIMELYKSPETLKLISENAKNTAKSRHCRDKIKNNLIEIYKEILN